MGVVTTMGQQLWAKPYNSSTVETSANAITVQVNCQSTVCMLDGECSWFALVKPGAQARRTALSKLDLPRGLPVTSTVLINL